MRIGPGGGGSSKRPRVKVSKSCIGPPQRLVLRQGLEQRSQLGPAVLAGQRQPQRLQVAADCLQLADELASGVVVEPVARACAELLEAVQSRPGAPTASASSASGISAIASIASRLIRGRS